MHVQSKNAAEEAKLAKKQEESEAVRLAHREEARLKEEVTRRRLEVKVYLPGTCYMALLWCRLFRKLCTSLHPWVLSIHSNVRTCSVAVF